MKTNHSTRSCKRTILDHVSRYSIGVERVLSQAIAGDVARSLRQLVAARQLREHDHPRGFRYVTLANRRSLSETAFIRRYAVLCFCESPGSCRSLLTRDAVAQYFPGIFRHGMPGGYYIDTSEQRPRFGHIRVDAVPAQTSRIVSRAANLIDRFNRNDGVRQLIAQRQFEITFVVATVQKARRLQMDFHKLRHSGVIVRAHAIPELLELIAPITTSNRSHSHPQRV